MLFLISDQIRICVRIKGEQICQMSDRLVLQPALRCAAVAQKKQYLRDVSLLRSQRRSSYLPPLTQCRWRIHQLPRKGDGVIWAPKDSATMAASSGLRSIPPVLQESAGQVRQTLWSLPRCPRRPRHQHRRARDQCGVIEKAINVVRQGYLFFRKSELHLGSLARFSNLGSRGIPRPRSLMMFFWICGAAANYKTQKIHVLSLPAAPAS